MTLADLQTTLADLIPNFPLPEAPPQMQVRKRNGAMEPVDVNKIVRAVQRCCHGLPHVDPMRVASKTIGGLFNGATTRELDSISIQTSAALIAEEPEYSKLAARLLHATVLKEVAGQNIYSFSQSIELGREQGLIGDAALEFVRDNARKLNSAVDDEFSDRFEYFGLRTIYDRYLLRHPISRKVIETPQYFFLRVSCGLALSVNEAVPFYRLLAAHDYMPSSPTLFNSGTKHPQMSSCYLIDSPSDSLEGIYDIYKQVAQLSKFSGGIGLAFHRVRSEGSLIRATNGLSNGIVPWLRTLDASVAAVNQGGKRKGAACVYLEPWHADVEQFLELRDNTGDNARRTYNLNTANWIPDIFMRRADKDEMWSLFDPKVVPHLTDLFGPEFDAAYEAAEREGKAMRTVKARDLYARMMRTLAETGNGWMTFKDTTNLRCNQTGKPGNVVHLSNLCTEITEVTSHDQTAVCNLGSVNLSRHVSNGRFDYEKLADTVRLAVPMLDRVIDINYYPVPQAASSNNQWRPVGLGVMGLQDVFFQLGLAFDSEEARELSTRIQEEIYYHALVASCDLAEKYGRGSPAVRPVGRGAERCGALGGAERSHQDARPAQFPAHRHRADRDYCVDRRLLRVHRAADLQHVQARDALGRVHADQPLPGAGTEGSRPVERGDAQPHQDGRGQRAEHRGAAGGRAHGLPHRVGAAHARHHRHGCGARRVHRPVAVAQPLLGVAQHRTPLLHVHACVEGGCEDHVLSALAACDAHR
jgi:ribonucleoside-diphosphate reductase alpha chain